jgi:TRAP-type mannitol/chloroaromatic compound transport system permease small subunit
MKDLLSGIVFLIFGIVFKIYSYQYNIGTASDMGPGYFPNLISTIVIILGVLIICKGIIDRVR